MLKQFLEKFLNFTRKITRKQWTIAIIAFVSVVAITVALTLLLVGGGNSGSKDKDAHPEHGVYYFDAKYDEYTLTLSAGNAFAFIVKGEAESGYYTLTDGALTLRFDSDDKANAEATYEDGVITVTYGDTSMRMLKKVNYSVTFETSGGTLIPAATVINGKTVAKPADPARDGYVFIGWYTDNEFKQPFSFDSQCIDKDTVIYARWNEASLSSTEYEVRFDQNYDGADYIAPITTNGGKILDLPTASRDGYIFRGWWISMVNDPAKLAYECTVGAMLDASTTVYALWTPETSTSAKIDAPIATVSSASVSWSAVNGARSYTVTVVNASGAVVFTADSGSTTVNVPFDTYAPGEYVVTVKALANSGDSNNSECVRHYVNKSLSKVSLFNVIEPSTLNFNTVLNAEKYIINVVCGNPDHNHSSFDNGASRTFSFANCEMPADGIKFTVTAVANGYASSTSEVFVYKRALEAVDGLRTDESTQTVHWNEVYGADYYMVSVNCSNSAHNHEFVNNGSKLSISLKECGPIVSGITVKVYPVAKGYASPEASEIKFNKVNIPTPSDITVSGLTVNWSAVGGAAEYEVKIGSTTYKTQNESFDLSSAIDLVEGNRYYISVRAIGTTTSLWSDDITAIYLEKPDYVSYYSNVLTWNPVIGADRYEVQLNGGEIVSVQSGITSHKITLNKAGINDIRVRFVDGNNYSEWTSVSVYAHTVTFDSRGGSPVETQYKAVGDKISLPAPTKSGYTFVDWYNVPGGPVSNGLLYDDEIFSETGSIVLYAYYTAVKVDVSLNTGEEAGGDVLAEKISYEDYFKLEVPTPLSPTMAFGGWYSAPYGLGTAFTDAKGNALSPWDSLSSTVLYAYWIDYALSFTLTKVNGIDAYMVSAGERIAMLDEVTIPINFNNLPVAMVAGNAFKNCTNLKTINLPDTLMQISLVDPFTGCTALEAVNVYSVDGNNTVRYWSDNGVLFDNGTSTVAQPKITFMPLAKTGSYKIPEGIVEIPEGAFANSRLSRITVPASVTKIASEAFANCSSLTSITFQTAVGEQALVIAPRAFLNCTSLEKITLPKRLSSVSLTKYSVNDSVVSLDNADNSFLGCSALESINIASGNNTYKSVDGVLYSKDGKTLIYCPATVTGTYSVPIGTQTIAPGAFVGCNKITKITIPNTVTNVGEYAFYKTALSSVTFSGNGFNDVTVGKFAFRECSKLKQINLEPGSRLSVLGEGAFYGCAIESFEIPSSATQIGKHAFYNCSQLKTLSFAVNGKSLAFEEGAFTGCYSLETVHIPANVSEIPGIFSGCTSLTSVTVDPTNPYFESDGGVIFNKGKTEILFFPQGKSGVYTLPDTVSVIADGVFNYITGITRLVIPNSITYIGNEAFLGSSIKEIFFNGGVPAGELHIGDRAFEMTNALTSIVLPAHTKSIGSYAFNGSRVGSISLNAGLETIGDHAFSNTYYLYDLSIPSGVQSIGDYCFSGSSVVSIDLNEGLKAIGKNAFENSYYINSITIPASVVSIGDHAFTGAWLSSVSFAENSKLESIGAYAFSRTQISSIVLPKSLTAIGAYAFYYCSSLTSVTFEKGGTADLVIGTPYAYTHKDDYTDTIVTEILIGHVFENATNLSTVDLPARLTEIKEYSFVSAGISATALRVTFEEGSRLATIGDYCFYQSGLYEIEIPASVRNLTPVVNGEFGLTYDRMGIGAYAFANTAKLVNVTFKFGSNEDLTIGKGAFNNAALLTSVTFPKRLAPYTCHNGKTVSGLEGGADLFNGATLLSKVTIEDGGNYYDDVDGVIYSANRTELLFCPVGYIGALTIPSSVTKINDKAFYACSGISAISFVGGNKDMTIGDSVFEGCTGITSIALPSNVVSIGSRSFAGCTKLTDIKLSKHIKTFDSSMIENCPALKSIEFEQGNGEFYYESGALYSADKKTLILYLSASSATKFTALSTTEIILDGAFENNTTLTEIVLPSGLRKIGVKAFAGCSALSKIEIPNTVELIDEEAFARCYKLANPEFASGGEANLVISKLAFANSGLCTITLPKRTYLIGDQAFASTKLETISFANDSKLEHLGNQVFEDTKITEIALPEGLISIGDSTFEGVKTLKKASLPASLQTIGINTFRACTSLTEVTFAQGAQLKALPAGTFAESGIKSITIPASVTIINNKEENNFSSYGVFESCTSLVSISFEKNCRLTEIGQRAFFGCSALKEIVVPSSVSTIGYLAFYRCRSLESVTIPTSTTKIGHSLFYECTSLKNVVFNSGTTEIPTYMFYKCSSLTTITIPANVSTLGDDCFYGTSLENFVVAGGNSVFASRDGILYSADFTEILAYPPCKKAATITIPKEITSIPADIFTGATGLKQVIFEEGGTNPLVIEASAFKDCYQLHTVILPERLKSIGTYAFANCYSLISITIPSSVESIGDYAFYNCYKLVEVYNKSKLYVSSDEFNGYVGKYALNIYTPSRGSSILTVDAEGYATIKRAISNGSSQHVTIVYLIGYLGDESDLIIPSYVNAFYDYAFYRLEGLESVFIPEGVCETSIGRNVFVNCGKPTIRFEGSSVPASWGNSWNSDKCTVALGCDSEEHTYTFVTNCNQTVGSITSSDAIELPTLDPFDDQVFLGWCTSPDLSGNVYTGSYYSASKNTLYAKWMSKDEVPNDGKSFDTAFELVLGEPQNVVIDASGAKVYYQFTPEQSGTYHVYVSGSYDAVLEIRSGQNSYHQNNIMADFDHPTIDTDLSAFTEGTTYYIIVRLSSYNTANLIFTLTKS